MEKELLLGPGRQAAGGANAATQRPVVRFALRSLARLRDPSRGPAVRLTSLGPVGLVAALRRRSGDGRREARSVARATVPSVKAGRCLRALGPFRRPAVQAKSVLSKETTFDGTYGRTWSDRRYRRANTAR